MYWDVKVVKPLENYRIYVELENNKKGIFDLKPYLERGYSKSLKMLAISIRFISCSVQ